VGHAGISRKTGGYMNNSGPTCWITQWRKMAMNGARNTKMSS
jgi:hypothetical protein